MVPFHHGSPPSEGVQFYPSAPVPPQPGFIPEMQESYQPMPTQSQPTLPPFSIAPQTPMYQPMEMPPQMNPQTNPPLQTNAQMPVVEPTTAHPSPQQQFPQTSPTSYNPATSQMDFYDNMVKMVSLAILLPVISPSIYWLLTKL